MTTIKNLYQLTIDNGTLHMGKAEGILIPTFNDKSKSSVVGRMWKSRD